MFENAIKMSTIIIIAGVCANSEGNSAGNSAIVFDDLRIGNSVGSIVENSVHDFPHYSLTISAPSPTHNFQECQQL